MNRIVMIGTASLVVGIAVGTVMSPAREPLPVEAEHEEPDPSGSEAVDNPVAIDTSTPGLEQPALEPVALEPEAPVDTAAERAALVSALSRMPAADVAPLLANLPDVEVLAALRQLPLTRASEILDAMPDDRGARLSRLMLLGGAGQ